jgi:hypothetical protein
MTTGPDRAELWVRLVISLVILVLIGVAIHIHGIPAAPGLVEVLGVGGLFGGISAWRAARGLWRR